MALTVITNPLEEDPFVYIEKSEIRESFLFDCGLKIRGNYRKVRKLWGVFITHAHIDHFVGFDHLIRTILKDDKELQIFGPRGILKKVEGKLAAYDWDRAYDQNLILTVTEITPEQLLTQSFICRNQFKPTKTEFLAPSGYLRSTGADEITYAFGNHGGSACIAYAMKIHDKWKVKKEQLAVLCLQDGPWVGQLLQWQRVNQLADKVLTINGQSFNAEELARELLFLSPGCKIVYITDTRLTGEVQDKMITLAQNADLLICEGTFLSQDAHFAQRFHHLTAAEAAEFAQLANVRQLLLNHPSRRYHGIYKQLLKEARVIFKNTDIVPYRGGLYTM